MFSVDRGNAGAPLVEGVETVSSGIPAPAPHSLEKCGACGTICGPIRSPQLLPCLHSVCKVCIPPAGVGESKRECPNCNRSYNVLEVTDNPLLKDSTTGPGAHPLTKCAGCEDSAISGWCVECGEALCSICVSAHQRVRVTREHTVLPQKLATGFIPTSFCPIHREEPMKLFCVSCNQLTCRDCQLTYHRNHSYQFLNEAVTAQREAIESLLVSVRQQRMTVKQSLLDLDGRLQDLEEIKSKTKSKMQKLLLYIRCALMKRTTELFKDVQDLCGHEAQKITERQNNLRTLEERQDYILSFAERALQMENHSALLSCKRQVQVQLQDLLSQSALPPASMIEVKLHFEQEAYCKLATFGKLVSNEVPFSHKIHDAVPNKAPRPPAPTQNVHPAPNTYQPYSSTHPSPSSSPSLLSSIRIGPPSVCRPSVSLPHSSAPSVSTSTSCAPIASASHQSATPSSFPSEYSHSSSCPPTSSHARPRPTAPSPPTSLPHPVRSQSQPSRQRKNKQTWSFHSYEPKNFKTIAPQPNPCSPESPQLPAMVSPPAAAASPPAVSESQSPPVPALPLPSPTLIMLLSPLDTCPEQWNARTVQTAKTGPAAVPQGPQSKSPSLEPAELTGCVQPDKEDQHSKSQQCVLPVIAPADSPCERTPPAGCERLIDQNPPTTENEPTSTVTETDTALPVGLPQAEGTELPSAAVSTVSRQVVNTDAVLAYGFRPQISTVVIGASRHRDAVPVDAVAAKGTAGRASTLPARGSDGVGALQEPQPAATDTPAFSCSLQNQAEVAVQSCHQPSPTPALTIPKNRPSMPFSSQDRSRPAEKPDLQPMQMQHEEGKASDSRSTDPNSAPSVPDLHSRAGPIQIPVRPLEKCNAWLPTTLKEILEKPPLNLALVDPVSEKNPILRGLLLRVPNGETELTDPMDYYGSPVETEKTDDDDDDDGEENIDTDPKNENEESGEPVSSHPLPQFRLLPGVTEDEILLQMIEDDDQLLSFDSQSLQFPDNQSAQAAKKRPAIHLSDQSKAKLIVLKGPISNPTQPRMSLQRANPCSAWQQPVSLDLTSEHEDSSLKRAHKAVKLRCAACQLSGSLTQCVQCGKGFHRDCHIPPISSASSGEWQCMLCRDLSDVEDLYSDERPKRPSLGLPDQRKCEHLLLSLTCRKYSAVLYRKVELSSHYIDITLIRGRLLRKLSPAYRTPSEFISDIWVLLDSLLKNSEDAALVFKMQNYFQKKLSKTFGNTLHPSLLKCPSREEGESVPDAEDTTGKVRETLKRMREFISANRQTPAKKVCKDKGTEPNGGEAEPKEEGQSPP